MNLMPIPNHEGYMVTETGEVYTCWKRTGKGTGHGTKCVNTGLPRKRMRTYLDDDGYERLTFRATDGKRKLRGVHQLVLEAFGFPRPSQTHEVRHLNGIPSDNHLENLKWGTPKENAEDRTKHGSLSGENNWLASLTNEQAAEIRSNLDKKPQYYQSRFGISKHVVSRIRNGKTYVSAT